MLQPHPQSSLVLAAVQPLVLFGVFFMVTPPPRFMASVRAKYSVLTMLSVVDLTFQRWIMGVKLGAATAVSTASTAITVSSSINVKPWARLRRQKGRSKKYEERCMLGW